MAATLGADGFTLQSALLTAGEIHKLRAALAEDLSDTQARLSPGVRNLLALSPAVSKLAFSGTLAAAAQNHLGPNAFPVRGILFEKSTDANWVVPFHQDVSIPVRNRVDVPGFGPWSMKEGVQHVQPPHTLLEGMLTLRLHLDDVDESNGPLLVFPRSHCRGILSATELLALQQAGSRVPCLARSGDILFMRPLLVHGSRKAVHPNRRRIVHVEYAAAPLPAGLEWALA